MNSLLLPLLLTNAPAQFNADIQAAIFDVASIYPVPAALVKAVIHVESDFNPRAVSTAGAIGLMQVMPSTALRVGLTPSDLWSPPKNILAGTRLLAILLHYYNGDVISCLVAYNARPRRLFASLPRNGETPKYVARVLHYYSEFQRAEQGNSRALLRSTSFQIE